eukprot:IDg4172t1
MASNDGGRSKGRFTFTGELDAILVKCVQESDAHAAKYGEVEKVFEGVRSMFCASSEVLKAMENGAPTPKVKTVRERFKALMKKRRKVNNRNIAGSGIEEEPTALDEALDSVIEEADNAKSRAESASDCEGRSPRKKMKKQAKVALELEGDSELKILEEDARARHANEAKRLELDERRLALEEKKMEHDSEERKAHTALLLALVKKLDN